jgi:hypothetical protein
MCTEVVMELFSREYGWTPEEIKKLSTKEVLDYLEIINARIVLSNKKIK